MHDIAQKQTFFFKLPELDLDPDLVVNFPDPDPAKRSGSGFGSATLRKRENLGKKYKEMYVRFVYEELNFKIKVPYFAGEKEDGPGCLGPG